MNFEAFTSYNEHTEITKQEIIPILYAKKEVESVDEDNVQVQFDYNAVANEIEIESELDHIAPLGDQVPVRCIYKDYISYELSVSVHHQASKHKILTFLRSIKDGHA